eukprot:GEMP01026782.1.p1 GENE.GEMP01026782.1~~GEMP01026782.1.p1  ORF type:complete len:650 (+),score=172.52 GEMP01026782.1:56-2005(+)
MSGVAPPQQQQQQQQQQEQQQQRSHATVAEKKEIDIPAPAQRKGRRLLNKAIESTANVDTGTAPTTPVKSQPPTPVGVKSEPRIPPAVNTAVASTSSHAEVLSKSATPLAVKQQVVPPVADSTSTLAVPPVAEDSPALLKKTGKRIMNKALPKSTTPISSPIIPAAVTNDSDAEEKEEAELARKNMAAEAAETKRKSEEEAAKKVALEKAMAEKAAAEAAEKQAAEEAAAKQAEEERVAEEKRQAEEEMEKIAAQKVAEEEKASAAAVATAVDKAIEEDTAKNGEDEQGKHEDLEDLSEAAKADAKERRKKEKKLARSLAKSDVGIFQKVDLLAYKRSVGDVSPECMIPGGLPKAIVEGNSSWRVDTSAKVKKEKKQKDGRDRDHRDRDRDRDHHNRRQDTVLKANPSKWLKMQEEEKKDDDAIIVRKMKGILNKLTEAKFEKLYNDLLESGIRTVFHIEALMKEVFDKAVTQHHFIPLYTKLCERLNQWTNTLPDSPDFRRILLTQCQCSFEQNLKPPEGLLNADVNDDEAFEKEIKYKVAMQGNIKFVGELLIVKLLASRVLIQCAQELLSNRTIGGNCSLISLECLATLLQVTGKMFDSRDWKYHSALADVYETTRIMSEDTAIPPRIRFLFRNIMDLRKNKWKTS